MNTNELNYVQNHIDYRFKNLDLLQQAFIRRSYSEEHGGGDNEVLEFIGDKALDLMVVKFLSDKYGEYFGAAKPPFRSNGNRLTDGRKPQFIAYMRRSRLSGVA